MDALHREAQKKMAESPSWLRRAMNPNTPATENNETVRTIDFESEGKMYIAPTLRMGKDGLRRISTEEAIAEAMKLGDAIPVPANMTGADFSKEISQMIGQARKHRGRKANESAETTR